MALGSLGTVDGAHDAEDAVEVSPLPLSECHGRVCRAVLSGFDTLELPE